MDSRCHRYSPVAQPLGALYIQNSSSKPVNLMCLSLKRPENRALRSENLESLLYYEVNFLVLFLNIVVGVKIQIKNHSNTKFRCFQRGLFDNTKKKKILPPSY